MADDFRLSARGLRVVKAFLEDPAKSWSGAELSKVTRTGSGTMYPLLARLEERGWLRATWEDIDPSEAGRPRRRFYRLSALGQRQARKALDEFQMSGNLGELAWHS